MKLGTDLVPHRQACGTGHPDPGQQNATPRAKKRNPDKKFMEGTRAIVRGRGSELFSGLRFFAWVHFVCDFTIQILYWILLLCTIYTSSSMRATLPRRLVGRSVSTHERERERASSNPAVCNFQPSEWSVLISDWLCHAAVESA